MPASNVKRVLSEASDYNVVITSMLATRGLLWVGTNVGVVSVLFWLNPPAFCLFFLLSLLTSGSSS